MPITTVFTAFKVYNIGLGGTIFTYMSFHNYPIAAIHKETQFKIFNGMCR